MNRPDEKILAALAGTRGMDVTAIARKTRLTTVVIDQAVVRLSRAGCVRTTPTGELMLTGRGRQVVVRGRKGPRGPHNRAAQA